MPRPKTDMWYAQRVAELAEEGFRGPTLARMVIAEAQALNRRDIPGQRTLERLCAEQLKKPPERRRAESRFRWPQAMREGLLPWEASAVALELLRWRDGMGKGRPSIRTTRWFWWVSLALPKAEIDARADIARVLAEWDYMEESGRGEIEGGPEGLEWWLAYHPWTGDADALAYQQATTRARDPLPPAGGRVITDLDTTLRFVLENLGYKEAKQLAEILENKDPAGGGRQEDGDG